MRGKRKEQTMATQDGQDQLESIIADLAQKRTSLSDIVESLKREVQAQMELFVAREMEKPGDAWTTVPAVNFAKAFILQPEIRPLLNRLEAATTLQVLLHAIADAWAEHEEATHRRIV
jgi:hypothetical protein